MPIQTLCERVLRRAGEDNFAKISLIALHIVNPGPPFKVIFEWLQVRTHRQALAALYSGDLFLGRYAGNFFAKAFIPHTTVQLRRTIEADVEASRVCMHCWHEHRQVCLEDEKHVLFLCPRYSRERRDLHKDLHRLTYGTITSAHGALEKMRLLLQSHCQEDWRALGRFVARLRQSCRRLRLEFQKHTNKLHKNSYTTWKAAWRAKGRTVCLHGTFFDIAPGGFQCGCLKPDQTNRWQSACYMPSIDPNLRSIVTVPFHAPTWQSLRVLQNTLRRQDAGGL